MKDTLVIFARAPRRGTVKRRLAAGIGSPAAFAWYRAQLARTLQALARDCRWRTLIAITPDHARGSWCHGVERVPQGRGDLGVRMARAMRCARRVAIVGSDIPGLCAQDVADAFRALGRADAAFGPADDGGYWLVALGPRRPAHPFARVRWSSEHALADTLANFHCQRVVLLRRLRDVDDMSDLIAISTKPFPA